MLIVYREGKSHVDDTGRIMKQFGTADGVTWTPPEVLYDEPVIDDRDPSVSTLANGNVVLTYFQYKTIVATDGEFAVGHVFVATSSDDGQTFGALTQVDPGSMSPTNPKLNAMGKWVDDANREITLYACSSPVLERNGQWTLPAYGGAAISGASPKWTLSMFETSTTGSTWTETRTLENALPDAWVTEPSLVRLASGKTLMHFRTADGESAGNAGKMMQSVSTDDRKTWSTPTPFSFVGHAPELAQFSSGLVLSAYRELDDELTREKVAFSWSLNEGSTWSDSIQVIDCGGSECGYQSIVELDRERFLLAYYAPGGKAIKAVIYRYSLE